jgi:alanyl-tRNA synthetase
VNAEIRRNAAAEIAQMDYDAAVAAGAMALFGEKYDSRVRVLRFGDFSMELCGGTHVERTGDIGFFKILGEGGVAAGVRRIEAITGRQARKSANAVAQIARAAAAELKTPLDDLVGRVGQVAEERRKLERDLAEARKRLAMGGGGTSGAGDAVKTVGATKLLARAVHGIEIKDLKSLADEGKKQVGSGIVAIVGVAGDGKAGLVVGVTSDLTQRFNAVDLVRIGAEALGGKGGGGRPDMAQAGGPDGNKASAALDSIERAVAAG